MRGSGSCCEKYAGRFNSRSLTLIARVEDASRRLHQRAEEVELLVGEPHLLAVVADEVGVELHLEVLVPIALDGRPGGPAP